MTDKISRAFEKGKAFIPFITAGDPDLDTTEKMVYEMEKSGADIIELGIPFSDPTAEGPVIMEANNRALSNKVTTDDVFALVEKIRKNSEIPLVFMTYANVVFSYGTEKFAEKMAGCRMNGLILPDVPYEEKHEFSDVMKEHGIDLISMIAPTSEDRIQMIAREADGFIYLVSSLGVTGTRSEITTDIGAIVKKIRDVTDTPVAVGFGISDEDEAKKMASLSDGAIVGSAIVKLVAKYGKESIAPVGEFVRKMKKAVMSCVN